MTSIRVAVAAYPVDHHPEWAAYAAKVTAWVADAAAQGAALLVFPEYGALELVSLLPPDLHHDVLGMRPALQRFLPAFVDLHAALARQHGVTVVAASFPVADGGRYVNRAYVIGPDGTVSWQDKLMMTRFEDEEWQISPGEGTRVFHARDVAFGVAICYDSEFPQLARTLAEGGAEVIVVPSFTGSRRGYTRVRVGSMARALENQLYALHAPLIADAMWTYAVEDAHGEAAIYAPSDHGLPEDGVVARGAWNTPGWLVHDLDLTLTRAVRVDGHVLNWRDRTAAHDRPTPPEHVPLGAAPAPQRPAPDVTVRVLTADDAPAYRAARLAALESDPAAFLTTAEEFAARPLDRVAARLHPTPTAVTLGAFLAPADGGTDGPALVGLLTVAREDGAASAHRANVYGVSVAPGARGRGVGRALLDAALAHARTWPDVSGLHLAVTETQHAARRAYERHGFRTWGRQPDAVQRDGQRAALVWMWRPLTGEPRG